MVGEPLRTAESRRRKPEPASPAARPRGDLVRAVDIFPEIAEDLAEVDDEILRSLDIDHPTVFEAATHLLRAGGKRIRPALVLLAGRFAQYDPARLVPLGAAVEMIHMATLVHDDVVDRSDTRRGWPTVRARWSDKIAVLAGDYLFAKAFVIVATHGTPEVIRILGEVVYNLSTGEIQQLQRLYSVDQDEPEYLQRIAKKTALFIAACCDVGAIASGAPPDVRGALRRYGYSVGMGFQIMDDILDLTAATRDLGKPAGLDLRSGVYTLPLIHALAQPGHRDRLRRLVALEELGDGHVGEIATLVEASGSMAYARQVAAQYIARAKDALAALPPVPTRDTLALIADFILTRSF